VTVHHVTLTLDIPPGPGPAWKSIEELKNSIENLDEELNLAIESQAEEFRTLDLNAYSDFLDSIDLDTTTKQNILTQLSDANVDVFASMLANAVELQVNGYVAAAQRWANGEGIEMHNLNFSPADIMDNNLNQDQLRDFFDFESARQAQRIDSTDARIAETLGRVGLLP